MTSKTKKDRPEAMARAAEIVREYGPFADAKAVGGVTHDGQRVWAATGARLVAFDPASGETMRTLDCAADAGTAFDGTYLYQIVEARIDKIDPVSGAVVASIPAPGQGNDSGLAWAEGSLWVGQYRDRKIHQIDPQSGAVLERLEMPRGAGVSGLESDRADLFYAGGGGSGKVRAVRRPKAVLDPAPEA
jgi:glutamine cyclotransferase